MPPPTSRAEAGEEISLMEVVAVLWGGRWIIIIAALTCAALATGIAYLIPKSYTATVVMAPVSDKSTGQLGGLAGIASQFGGLASLAGISLPTGGGKAESVAVLQSDNLTAEYIRENDLLPILFADEWNADTKAWRTSDPKEAPTLWKANRMFKRDIRTVGDDPKTGLVTMRISWKDPVTAAQWANDLVELTNKYLRNRAIEQSRKNIAYLQEQADKTSTVDLKQRIYTVMQAEISEAMVAEGTSEFAFRVLDPAVPPEKQTSPRKSFWLIGGGFLGGLFATVFVALRRSGFRPASVG